MQHSEDHSVVPTGQRAINTAIHRTQAPLILASLGRSCLCQRFLSHDGAENSRPLTFIISSECSSMKMRDVEHVIDCSRILCSDSFHDSFGNLAQHE